MKTWLLDSWRALLPAPWSEIALVFVSVLCGIFIGMERQRHDKPAGLRTLAMVSLGATVFTLVSYAFVTTTGDSGRVAAQIVTGIGFLGAGVILHGRRIVSGMTTAAIIWVTAAIGIAVGAGYAPAGLGLSLLVTIFLRLITLYERRFVSDLREAAVEIGFAPAAGRTRVRLERILVDYHVPLRVIEWDEGVPENARLRLRLRMARIPLAEMLDEMVELPEVVSIAQAQAPAKAGPPTGTTPS